MDSFIDFILKNIQTFLQFTAFANLTGGHLIMICIGLVFIYLAIAKGH